MASTTTNITASETEGEEQTVAEGEDDEDAITGDSGPAKRIVLTKTTIQLVFFIIITVLAILATGYTIVFHLDEYDYPPTESSEESLRDTVRGLILLSTVTMIGIFILKFRIGNLLIGVLYLFLLVLCMVFALKGITYGVISLNTDEINTLQQFAENPAIEHKLHNFWAAHQKRFACCGTREIDKVEDWSYFLNTTDLPATCCSSEQIQYAAGLALNSDKKQDENPNTKYKPELDPKTSYCGRGLARTRNKGLGFDKTTLFKRPFSGFFLSLTAQQVGKMHSVFRTRSSRFEDDPNRTLVDQLNYATTKIETVGAHQAFMRNWKTFYLDNVCNTVDDLIDNVNVNFQANGSDKACTFKNYDHPNDIAYPASMDLDDPIKSIGVILDISEAYNVCTSEGWELEKQRRKELGDQNIGETAKFAYCNKTVPNMKINATTIGRELLLRLDYLTTYIYEFSEESKNSQKVHEGTWVLWKIPTRFDPSELYPFKLNANYLRSSNPNDEKNTEAEVKQMYYFSRGIAENMVLKSAIHEKSCELLDESHKPGVKSKLARDLNKRWRKSKPFSNWKNSEEGLGQFFLDQVQKLMYITIFVSSCDIVCVVILAVVFWQYYSKNKAEEYANLALPKEFEVLHLRRASLIDERDIVKDTVRLGFGRQRRVGPSGKGAQQRKGPPRERGQRGQPPAGPTSRPPPQQPPAQSQSRR